MILSHHHHFVFLKTNKTAGTSMEIALAKMCGPDDIITPVSPKDEALRKSLGIRGPQNYSPAFSKYSRRDWFTAVRRLKRKRFYNHMPAREVKQLVPPDVWQNYFKFCFERNPWDRMLSLYAWRCQTEPKPTLGEFIDSRAARDLTRRGIEVYTIDGQVVVDRVCQYENLDAELQFLRERLGLPEPLILPHAKASHRTDRRHYREIFQPHEADKIKALFRREISLFGYTF
jgi:hypothetical protein